MSSAHQAEDACLSLGFLCLKVHVTPIKIIIYRFDAHSTLPTMVALTKSTTQFLAWTASKGIETPLDLNERSDGSRYTTANVDVDW
jgi:hypothetical protein